MLATSLLAPTRVEVAESRYKWRGADNASGVFLWAAHRMAARISLARALVRRPALLLLDEVG